MEKKIYKTLGFYICIISIIASCFLLYQLVKLNLFSILWIGIVLFALIGFGFYLLFKHKVIGNILLVLIVIVSSSGSFYIHQTNETLENVAMPSVSEAKFMLVSLKENDSVQKLGVSSIGNVKLQDVALSKLPGKYDFEYFDSYLDMGEALNNGNVDCIFVSDISYELLLGMQSIHTDNTKIIKDLTIEVDTTLPSVPVDVTKEPFTVYISGHDLGEYSTAFSHSDVNILMTINPTTHQILMLGIPRDSYIPQTAANNQKDKLTHTGLYGSKCIVDSVSNFFDIPINYYVEVDFNSLIEIVDALGGITVYSPNDFVSLHGGDHFVVGNNKMNGKQALGFVRERYSFEDGDKERSRNQMRVLKAIINKAMSPAIVKNYTDVMKTVSKSFKSNMSQKEMTSFVSFQLTNLKDWDIQQIQIGGTALMTESPALGFEVYMMDPDMKTVESASSLIKKILNEEKVSEEDILHHNSLVTSNKEWMANL